MYRWIYVYLILESYKFLYDHDREEIGDQAPSSTGVIFLDHNRVFPQVSSVVRVKLNSKLWFDTIIIQEYVSTDWVLNMRVIICKSLSLYE